MPALPALRFHALRHSAATNALAAGVPVQVVSEMLGHADVAFTMKIYVHVLEEQRETAAETIESPYTGMM